MLLGLKFIDEDMKNNYIRSSKIAINKGKNMYKRCVCNRRAISWLWSFV